LRRKIEIGHLVKTNPIKPNFTRHSVWRAYKGRRGLGTGISLHFGRQKVYNYNQLRKGGVERIIDYLLLITNYFLIQEKFQMRTSCLIAAVLFIAAGGVCEPAFAVPAVQDIVEQVSQTTYRHYLDDMLYTHLGDDRQWGPEHDLARTNIYTEFNSFGLDTILHPFSYSGQTYYNVVGVHYGATRPEDIYIVGAHYDSTSDGAGAPGADDNASGTAGVLEAARVLSQFEFEATLIFVGFDREEQGLFGSSAYAQEHKDDDILGMISLDMIAYNGSGLNKARTYGRDSSAPLKQSLADSVSLYGNGLSCVDSGRDDYSDHAPFEAQGFQACLLIEYDVLDNPYYHSVNDSVDMPSYIDYSFATDMVSSTVGFLATAAVPIPEPASVLLLAFGAAVLRTRLR
jgi:hypothetical protein